MPKTRQHSVWNICETSTLLYKDIAVLIRVSEMIEDTKSINSHKKLIEIMSDWLDLENRKSRTSSVTKETIFYGVYDAAQMDAVNSMLKLLNTVRISAKR